MPGGHVFLLIVCHMTVSSTMLVLNKAVLQRFPVATTVLLAQVGSSAAVLWVLGRLRVISVDPFNLNTARAFFWNAAAFMVLIFTNARALESANVEAVIVCRTLSIFVTAYGDFRLLQARELSPAGVASLCLVVGGAVGYVLSEKGFEVRSVAWVLAYGVANAAYPIVTKLAIVSNADMTSWGRTYYNNLMTFIVFVPIAFITGEHHQASMIGVDAASICLLLLSCAWGTAISFLGFLVLENVSPTTFNVMGNANKLLTLAVNHAFRASHASAQANLCLLMSLVGAAVYGAVRRREGADGTVAVSAQPVSAGV